MLLLLSLQWDASDHCHPYRKGSCWVLCSFACPYPYFVFPPALNRVLNPPPAHTCAMTFGTLLPPVSLTTGLNVHGLLDLLEDLDTDSAGNLARYLLRGLAKVREEQRAVLCIPLVQAYVERLVQACTITAEQCPQSQLDPEHLSTIVVMTAGLLWRVRVRIWFLRADALLEDGALLPRHQQAPTAALWRG